MPIRLDIKKKLSVSSERVKSVDIHPTESWALAALYSGNVTIWDYESGSNVKTFEVSELPVRCAKFITRKQWFVASSDDMRLRVYNYNTMEKIKDFEAHSDYIRYVEVHPSLPYFLTSSDDMTIKCWDWDRGFDCTQLFEGHAHYVMMVKFNPKDSNTFASASLDRSIKVWGLGSPMPHYTLEGHERGVNCIDYYPSGDKPYILSGADDRTVKVWDYQTKSIVHSLDGHSHNICSVLFHPKLPLICSASEDGTVRLWQSTTYRAETTLNYGMERAWALAATKETTKLAIGFDEGCVVVELGSDDAVVSMDGTGKVVWAKNNEIQTTTVKGLAGGDDDDALPDGDRLPVVPRDLGACELYPQSIKHNCNGRFIAVCGDGEFIIYTAQALRNKAFGQAIDFVWSATGTGDYAIRESVNRIKFFKNFKESRAIKPATASADGLFGGHLLGVKGGDSAVLFYDWDSGEFVRKIDVAPKEVYWSDSGNLVLIACGDSAYVLSYNAAVTASAIAMGQVSPEDGVDGSFDLLYEISDNITSGQWVGDCFIYCNNAGRLNYSVGGKIQTLVHLDTNSSGATMHSVLGYLAKEDRVYLVDKSLNIVSYRVMLAVLQYQTAVMRGDFDAANELLSSIPETEYTTIARFLEAQGFKEEALEVTTDDDHKFDLALELGKIDIAHELMKQTPADEKNSIDTMAKWKKLSDAALKISDFELTEACSLASDDFPGLLLLYSAVGNFDGMEKLAKMARAKGKTNIAFVSYLLTGNVEECANLLIATNRLPEAAFFARTYLPSRVEEIVSLWKDDLIKVSETAAKALADPATNPELFPDRDVALQVEQMFIAQREATKATGINASDYPTAVGDLELDLIALIKSQGGGGAAVATPPPPPAQESAAPPPPAPAAPVGESAADDEFVDADDGGIAAAEAEATAAQEAAQAAEAARLAQEAEQQRLVQEAEQQRLVQEAEQQRLAQEAEQQRLAQEAEEKRLSEEEAARIAADEEEAAEAAKEDDMGGDFGDDW